MSEQIVYLNGALVPLSEARISVLDRGFIFGDGIYEVIPVYGRVPFRLAEHVRRLESSLAATRIENPHPAATWESLIADFVARQIWDHQSVYLQVTRGVAKRDHAFPVGVPPTVFMMANAFEPPPQELVAAGVAAVTASDYRWARCDIKSVSLLGNVLLRQIAVDADAAETVMFKDGFLTEGSASNIFVVKNGVILTPPKSHMMLPGITYDVVLELAAANGMALEIREVREREVLAADELWLTSSSKEVLAVTRLDGRPVGSGVPGPVFQRMHRLYQELKAAASRAEASQSARSSSNVDG